jgi:hypothetical protein
MSWKYAEGNSHGLIKGDILRSKYSLQLLFLDVLNMFLSLRMTEKVS